MKASAHPDLVAEMLLRWYRQPERYAREMQAANEATGSLETVVRLALSRPVTALSPAFRVDGIAAELKSAALFFLHRVLFRPDTTHYQVLGLQRDATPAEIREHHRLLIQVVHPDRGTLATAWPPSIAARINRAYAVLRNAPMRARYDAESRPPVIDMPAPSARRTEAASPKPLRAPTAIVRRAPGRPSPATSFARALGDFVRVHPRAAALSFAFTLGVVAVCMILWLQDLHLSAFFGEDAAADTLRWSMLPGAVSAATAPSRMPAGVVETAPRTVTTQGVTKPAPASVARRVGPNATPSSNAGASRTQSAVAQAPAPPAITTRGQRGVASPAIDASNARPSDARAHPANEARAHPASDARAVANSADARSSLAADDAHASPSSMRRAEPARSLEPTLQHEATPPLASASALVPADGPDVEGLIAAFVSGIQAGKPEMLAAWLAADARMSLPAAHADLARAGAAQAPRWRRIERTDWRWRAQDDGVTRADGDLAVRYANADGRESTYRLAVEMDIVRRDGRTLVTRYAERLQAGE